MAKLIAADPPAERAYTIQLTERELGTLFVALGRTTSYERQQAAEDKGVKILDYSQQSHRFFLELERILKGDVTQSETSTED